MKIFYGALAFRITLPNDFPKIPILASFFGIKDIKPVAEAPWCGELFLDSGAFSAFTKNEPIDLKQYIAYVQANKNIYNVIASLDDITSFERSVENYRIMREEGLNPLPTYHIGEPEWVLEKYLETSSYIALGGIAKQPKAVRVKWLDKIFSQYPDESEVGFHGFGVQDIDLMMNYPWRTVDASSARMQARYGGIGTPWGWLKINKTVQAKDLQWVSPADEKIVREWTQTLGYPINYDLACESTEEGGVERSMVTILYYEQLIAKQRSFVFAKKKSGFGMK